MLLDQNPITIRIPSELVNRLDALCDAMDRDPHVEVVKRAAGYKFPRSVVMREVVMLGLTELEKRYNGSK